MTLQEQLGKPVLFHWCGWHGKDNKPSVPGYDSRDPDVVTHQLKAMHVLGGSDCGVIALSFGLASEFIQQALMVMGMQCNALGMPFGLCFDPWTVKNSNGSMPSQSERNDRMIAALKHPETQFLLDMQCYLPGRPVLDFATGCDPSVITAAVPGIQYWLNGPDYDWVRIPEQPNKTQLPCVYPQFDDGTGADRNKSCWDQSKPARIVPPMGGGTFWDCDVSGAKDYVQFVTWNDYHEGTQVEPYAAMLAGKI